MTVKICVWITLIMLLEINISIHASEMEDILETDAESAIIARLLTLQNIMVKYRVAQHYSPPADISKYVKDNPHLRLPHDSLWNHSFRYLDGLSRYEKQIEKHLGETTKPTEGIIGHRIVVYSREELQQLHEKVGSKDVWGLLDKPAEFPVDAVIDISLGLRMHSKSVWLSAEMIQEGMFHADGGYIKLVIVDQWGSQNEWIFDPKQGYALLEYRLVGKGQEFPNIELKNSDFRMINGIILPFIAVETVRTKVDGVVVRTVTSEVSVEKYEVASENNVPEDYHIRWPEGSIVMDQRISATFRVNSSGKLVEDVSTKISNNQVRNIDKSLPNQSLDIQSPPSHASRADSSRSNEYVIVIRDGTPNSWWAFIPLSAALVICVSIMVGMKLKRRANSK